MQTDIDSQLKKSLSPKKQLTKNEKIAKTILENKWWPFERASGRLLEKLHKERKLDEFDLARF